MYSYIYVVLGNVWQEDKTIVVIANTLNEANEKMNYYTKLGYKTIILDNRFKIDVRNSPTLEDGRWIALDDSQR